MLIPWFSALLALCEGNSPVTGEFSSQRPVTRSFEVFFDLCLNKRLRHRWLYTPTPSLWLLCNVYYSCCTNKITLSVTAKNWHISDHNTKNNREAGDLGRHRAHYDITVMTISREVPMNLISEGWILVGRVPLKGCAAQDLARISQYLECEIHRTESITEWSFEKIPHPVVRWAKLSNHDDVIKWKPFPRYWPFARGIHRSPVTGDFPAQRASDAELWCFLWSASE